MTFSFPGRPVRRGREQASGTEGRGTSASPHAEAEVKVRESHFYSNQSSVLSRHSETSEVSGSPGGKDLGAGVYLEAIPGSRREGAGRLRQGRTTHKSKGGLSRSLSSPGISGKLNAFQICPLEGCKTWHRPPIRAHWLRVVLGVNCPALPSQASPCGL